MGTPKIRGIQPLAWGNFTIDGYVNESTGEDTSTEEELIADEQAQTITQVTGFGMKTDVTLEVIPKAKNQAGEDVTAPNPSDIFTYGAAPNIKSITVISVSSKRTNKGVMKWTIKGNRFPDVPLTGV